MKLVREDKAFENIRGQAAETLIKKKHEVLSEWERQARDKIPGAAALEHPILINTVPTFLDNLIEALAENHPRILASDSNTVAKEHGGERARLTRFGPDLLIQEYQILRDILFEKLEQDRLLTRRERDVVLKSMDQAVQEAMMAFFLVHSKIREQFVVGLSHDLRNPLGAVKMAAEIIISSAPNILDQSVRNDISDLAERVVNNAKRADRLIQDLLDTSILQFGEKLPLTFKECEISRIVNEAIAELSEHDQERTRAVGQEAKGYWDPDALRRALDNLIANAIKYGTPNTPITIRYGLSNQRMLLSVHNEGPHIPIEEQEGLFQPFMRSQQAKTSGKKGWGIGLALVRGVAEGHGGSFALDSAPGMGTTFLIDVPADSRPLKNAPTTQ